MDQPPVWKAFVTNLGATDFQFSHIGKAGGYLLMSSAELSGFNIGSSTIHDWQKLLATNNAFRIKNVNGRYSDPDKNLLWYNGGFTGRNNTFTLDSFIYNPVPGRDSFFALQKFQTDYIHAKTGEISIGPIDIDGYIKDTTLKIAMITIDNGILTDFKDKNLPFAAGIIKPLPVNMIKKIPFKLSVDSVVLNNTHVEYTEAEDKTKGSGTIPVTRMTIIFNNVKTYNYSTTDSLRILAIGYLMDSIWTRLRVKESYTDSLSGFLMSVRMKPADITVLNSVLIPMASVKIESAYLDTMSMRATGKEYIAYGQMDMFYHDLKVKFLKDGDETKKSFLKGLLTFIANSFVIRNKNTSRSGLVFFIRLRDRSAINYLVKIAMSGIASSVGAKSSRKMMRKYEKDLKRHRLPPVNFD